MEISGKRSRITVPVIIEGEEIALVTANPYSPLVMRDMANIIKLLDTGMPDFGDYELSDEDKAALEGGDVEKSIEAVKRVSEPLAKAGDFIDSIIAACDKLFGAGVTETILANDDAELSILRETFNVVFREVADARKALSDKYKV